MKTILIVDDEYPIVDSISVFLKMEGYRVVSASNGKEGLAQVKAEKPDMVLVDYMMPLVDGRMFVKQLRGIAEFRSLPVVMMSASTGIPALLASPDSAKLNVAAFLHKPFLIKDLITAIHDLIGAGDLEGLT